MSAECKYNGLAITVDTQDPRFAEAKTAAGLANPALILDSENIALAHLDEGGKLRNCDFFPIINKPGSVQDIPDERLKNVFDKDPGKRKELCKYDQDEAFIKEKERLEREFYTPQKVSLQYQAVAVAKIASKDEIVVLYFLGYPNFIGPSPRGAGRLEGSRCSLA
jgi:hypothetical protein